MAGPGAGHLERFEGRHSLGQARPNRLVEIEIVDTPVEPRRFVIAGVAADIADALRAKADIAADMPGQRHRLELFANFEIKRQPPHRRDGHLHAELAAQSGAPAIGGVDDALGRYPFARFEPHPGNLLAPDIEINDPVLQVADSQAYGLAAKSC